MRGTQEGRIPENGALEDGSVLSKAHENRKKEFGR
jgi:hypothetical protein